MSTLVANHKIDSAELRERIARFQEVKDEIVRQVRRVIVGQEEVLDQVLIALFVGGHCLITGLPGTAKTLLVRTMAQTLGLEFRRIQFTPDLMPSDVTGTDIIEEDPTTGHRTWTFVPGPIFANVLLADEINRTPPKTQSALLEAMQERTVSLEGRLSPLSPLFTVFATQNPVESEGTYPLPEAQLDRFLFKVEVGYPTDEEEEAILAAVNRGFDSGDLERAGVRPAMTRDEVLQARAAMAEVTIEPPVLSYVRKLVAGTRKSPRIRLGAGPRAAVHLLLAAKALAALRGRGFVTPDDVRYLAGPVLKHRLLLSPDAELDGATPSDVLREVVGSVEVPR